MIAHMFAGASTPIGFVDLFDNILPVAEAKTRLFLKGASGSGKSTFMKKVAAQFEARGISTERFHCANDADSLDAIMIPSIGVSIMDATSPHSHDPEIAIAIDRILDFAVFIDDRKLEPYLDELKSLAANKKLLTKKVTSYLAAVGSMYDAENNAFESALDKRSIKARVKKCLDHLYTDAQSSSQERGRSRKLFLSALTPDGFVSFADKLFRECKVYGVSCDIGVGRNIFMEELKNLTISRGIDVTSFYNPISPTQVESLYFPQMSVAITCVGGRFSYDGTIEEIIELNDCIYEEVLDSVGILEQDCDVLNRLLDKSISAMYCARKLHARTEEIYISTMNFDGLNKESEAIIQDLLMLCDTTN